VDLDLTPRQAEFLEEARSWLAAHRPAGSPVTHGAAEEIALSRAWDRQLYDAGWSVLPWPKDYGGRDASILDWLLFEDAYHEAQAPYRLSQNGISLLGPTVLEYGTERQKDEILRPMARGDLIWAQAWSEPGSGSDLASLTSRASPVPGGFRLDGRKIWSSNAPSADMAFGLFRTGTEEERHRGLTYVLVPLDAPGVTVEPIRRLDGAPTFAEITFDNVFVSDDAVLGGVGQGWTVTMATTGSERGFALRSPGRLVSVASRLRQLLQRDEINAYPDLAEAVMQVSLDAQAFRLHVLQSVDRLVGGRPSPADSSLEKLFWSELEVRAAHLAVELLSVSTVDDNVARSWLEAFVAALPGTIWGGTNEIQRNIVAQRLLNLPRSY
jgi:alkylation response protein AidB-like acyl-CoA dehydrogenase